MISLAQHGLSHNEIELRLRTTWRNKLQYRVDLIRQNTKVEELKYTSCSYRCDSAAQIKYTGQVTCSRTTIDMNRDMFQPVMYVEDEDLFEFRFVPLRIVDYSIDLETNLMTLQGMDSIVILQNTSIGYPLYIHKGEVYISVVEKLIRDVGFSFVEIEPDGRTFLYAREDWASSATVLEIINGLLSEINYKSLEVGLVGTPRTSEYVTPSYSNIPTILYSANKESIIFHDKTTRQDTWGKANIFQASVFTQDMEQPLYARYENNNPSDPTSTSNNPFKLIHEFTDISDVSDKDTLYDVVYRRAVAMSQSHEYATMATAIMPHHETNEILHVESQGIKGIWEESSWEIDGFSANGKMVHHLKRMI